jgi:cell wall-associated NlpC family hydrolase
VHRLRPAAVLLLALTLLDGCGSLPPRAGAAAPAPVEPAPPAAPAAELAPAAPASVAANRGDALAHIAESLVGTRYQFGGADQGGFDCSGLAFYVHQRVGIAIPRTAADQQRLARPVELTQLEPGDLVFFSRRSHRVDHVGIYAGSGLFIHARHQGVPVSYGVLNSTYYAHHLVSAGRFWN